jgi:hypothetical protein
MTATRGGVVDLGGRAHGGPPLGGGGGAAPPPGGSPDFRILIAAATVTGGAHGHAPLSLESPRALELPRSIAAAAATVRPRPPPLEVFHFAQWVSIARAGEWWADDSKCRVSWFVHASLDLCSPPLPQSLLAATCGARITNIV